MAVGGRVLFGEVGDEAPANRFVTRVTRITSQTENNIDARSSSRTINVGQHGAGRPEGSGPAEAASGLVPGGQAMQEATDPSSSEIESGPAHSDVPDLETDRPWAQWEPSGTKSTGDDTDGPERDTSGSSSSSSSSSDGGAPYVSHDVPDRDTLTDIDPVGSDDSSSDTSGTDFERQQRDAPVFGYQP